MDKAQVQDILDDFIVKNESNFDRVSDENPILYNAVIDALDFLSSRFGTGVHTPKVVKEEIKVEEKLPLKVGDYFINKALEPPIIFKIIEFTDNDSQVVFVDADYGDSSFRFSAGVFEMVNNISSGKWVKVEPKSVEGIVKVGDIFQDSADEESRFKVLKINNDTIDLARLWNGEIYSTQLNRIEDRIKKGTLIKVTEKTQAQPQQVTKTASVKKPKKASASKEIRELKEAIEGLEAVEEFLEDEEKRELAELRKKLSDLKQKNS